ncbi:MAG: ABC transporter permease subunit [Helicobacter sp.]|nr:ABC transporter permease subunit [Helicobacter sp.]
MARYILARILWLLPLSVIVSIIVFALLRFSPVDAALAYLVQSQIPPTEMALQSAREELGLDKPFFTQYFLWLKNALHFDFGVSFVTKRPVLDDLLYYLPTTLYLTFASMLLVVGVSIPLGMLSAIYKNSVFDRCVRFLCFIGVCAPSFWVGFLLVYIFSVKLGWFNPYEQSSYFLPVLTLSFMSLCINIRIMRSSVLEHKLSSSLFYTKLRHKESYKWHLLKNSLLPVLTSFGMHFGELLGGAVVVEMLFSLPGIGRYTLSAITNHDYPVMQCFMLLMCGIFVLLSLLVDICYCMLNPKITYIKEG